MREAFLAGVSTGAGTPSLASMITSMSHHFHGVGEGIDRLSAMRSKPRAAYVVAPPVHVRLLVFVRPGAPLRAWGREERCQA